jgi:hypothetical protein
MFYSSIKIIHGNISIGKYDLTNELSGIKSTKLQRKKDYLNLETYKEEINKKKSCC